MRRGSRRVKRALSHIVAARKAQSARKLDGVGGLELYARHSRGIMQFGDGGGDVVFVPAGTFTCGAQNLIHPK